MTLHNKIAKIKYFKANCVSLNLYLKAYILILGLRKKVIYNAVQVYHINPKYWDRLAWANSADQDLMLQNAASDLDLHCLPPIKQF